MVRFKKSGLYKSVFGYDIFISYSRKDSLDYAYAIAEHFMAKGYECYIDQLASTNPGKELPDAIKSAVTKSTSFVLVGSEGAKTSEPINKEIKLFFLHNKNKPFIPITIDGKINDTSLWFEDINGLAMADDTKENLEKGKPSEEVLNRIENALNFTKKSRRLRYMAVSILVAVLFITAGAIGFTVYKVREAAKDIIAANKLAKEQTIIAENAGREAAVAIKQKKAADSITGLLNKKADSLNEQIAIKNIKIDETLGLYTRQYQSAEQLYNEFDKAVAAIPATRSYCSGETFKVRNGELTLYFQKDRSNLLKGAVVYLDNFIRDWKNSGTEPEIIIEGHYSAYIIDEQSLDVFKLNNGGTEAYNKRLSDKIHQSVAMYLMSKGIPSSKITGKGKGSKETVKSIIFNNRAEIYTAN